MAMRITTALFSAALLMAACGKSDKKPAAQPVPEGQTAGEAPKPESGAERAAGEAAPAMAGASSNAVKAAVAESTPNAVVEMIEFSDFQCPFCSRVNPTLKELKSTYGDKLKVVFLHQPLPFHKQAKPAALAAEAARNQGKFWEMHDKLFANQKALSDADLEKYAGEIGLDMEKYKKDMADPATAAIVDRHQAIAGAVGATGTPAFFINGKNLRGAQPVDEFKKIIDAEVTAAGSNKGDAYIRERLKTNNAALHSYVYEGKTPPKRTPPKPRVDKTVYKVSVDPAADAIKGNPNALVTMVVFSEFQCPFCRKVKPTVDKLMDEYGDKVRLVFKHSPLPFHKNAMPASNASLCAKEQGKFWEYHDKLFDNQQALDDASLEKYAGELGLDAAKWKACFSSNKYQKQIEADQELGGKVTARGTPNTFINGRKLTGAKPIEEFKTLIDEEMKRAEATLAKGVAADRLYDELVKDGKVFEPLEEKVNTFKLDNSPTKGPKNAKIQIVEFSDFQCPFCSRVTAPLNDLQAKYGDKLSVTFKHFPLSFHKEAMPAALASMCANEQGKFWEYHDQIFANQKALGMDNLKQYATDVGLDVAKYEACMSSNKYQDVVNADMAEARQAQVRGTPTIFINGRKFNSNTGYNVAAFSKVIDKLILGK